MIGKVFGGIAILALWTLLGTLVALILYVGWAAIDQISAEVIAQWEKDPEPIIWSVAFFILGMSIVAVTFILVTAADGREEEARIKRERELEERRVRDNTALELASYKKNVTEWQNSTNTWKLIAEESKRDLEKWKDLALAREAAAPPTMTPYVPTASEAKRRAALGLGEPSYVVYGHAYSQKEDQ